MGFRQTVETFYKEHIAEALAACCSSEECRKCREQLAEACGAPPGFRSTCVCLALDTATQLAEAARGQAGITLLEQIETCKQIAEGAQVRMPHRNSAWLLHCPWRLHVVCLPTTLRGRAMRPAHAGPSRCAAKAHRSPDPG